MNYGKTSLITVIVGAIIVTIIALFYIHSHYPTIIVTIPKRTAVLSLPSSQKEKESEHSSSSQSTLPPQPSTLLLTVPFTPQAPTGNWDQLHNEACEEAVSIMTNEYFTDDKSTTLLPDFVEGQIDKLTEWQDRNYGYHLDTTSAETAKMIESVYGLKTRVIDNFTADEIKNELFQNHLVIISENGQKLGNPYYKQPGPIHHMLLVKGYTSNGTFVTNDSGTKRGLNYAYDFNTLYNAAADWDHSTNTVDGNKKIAIVVWK